MLDRIYQTGNTVRLTCQFHDFNGETAEPQIVKLKLYDDHYKVTTEFTGIQQIEPGVYYFDYTTEEESAKIYYEWYAEIDGTPSLKRSSFTTRFI